MEPDRSHSDAADPYRELFEHSADAILIIDGDTFVDCNQATVDMLRCRSRAEVLATHPSALSPPTQPDGRDSYEKANEMIAAAFARGNHRFVWDHRRADGEVFPVEVLLTAVERNGKRILHVVWRDITERKRLEEQLRHTQKMEAIGRLAGGVAHDFNNLLVAIIGNADILLDLVADQAAEQSVNEIIRAAERGAILIRQLLAFSRKQEYAPVVVDLNQVLDDLDSLLRRVIGETVELVVTPSSTAVMVKADPNQLELVVINLVTNARDAMAAARGTLAIEVGRATVSDASPPTVGRLEPGEYAVLAVSDTGHGVDQATVARMFDPFFTTKEVGKGTGLGLAAVLGVATQGGGSIGVTSEPGRGTTITVYLPLTHEAPSPVAADELLPDPHGDETILIVEDDEAVAAMMTSTLRSRGYRVIVAANGHQALALWEHYGDQVDLVVCDVVMPAVNGPEMVGRLHAAGHRPRVLFVSGYTADALAALDHLALDIDLLEKPFSARELGRRVRRALDR